MKLCTRRALSILRVFALLSIGYTSLSAQTTIASAGNPANSAVFPIEHGFVNLASGEVHLEIPIANIPQRGDLTLPAAFVYDSSIWEVVNGISGLQWSPTLPGGWSFQYSKNYGSSAAIATHPCSTNSSVTIYDYTAAQWRDAQGTVHTFPLETIDTGGCSDGMYTDTPTDSGFATDASGYYASVTGYTNLTVWDPHGTKVVSSILPSVGASDAADVDRNGNIVQYGLDGTVQSDSLQHSPIQETIASTDVNGFPVVLYLDVPVAQSHTARYTITYENVATSTSFGVSASNFVSGASGNVGEFAASIRVIQSIGLPDGTNYRFSYDTYGELSGITLPHGGGVGLGFSNDAGAGTLTPPRWVSYHSGSDGTTGFSYVNAGSYTSTSETGGYSCSKIVNTVSGAVLTQTYVFSSCGGAIQPMKLLLSPTSNPSVVDKFTLFQYDFSHPCQKSACTGAQGITLIGMTTVIPTSGSTSSILASGSGSGLISDVQTTYDTSGSGVVTAVKQWDYYSGTYPTALPDSPPGLPKRETDTTLGYAVNNIPYPTSIVAKDSSGSVVTEVQYTYDEAGYLTSSSGVPNHDNSLAASARGNATTVRQIPHGAGAPTLTYQLTYDDAGAVVATKDASGNITFITHDVTDTFPQTVIRPQTSGLTAPVSHQTTTTRDPNTGQVLTVVDENGQATSNQYDGIGRLSSVQFTNGGSPVTLKTFSYISANETDASTLQVQDAYETASIPTSRIVDGYGRAVQAVQDGVTSETSYDAQGHVYSVTNPHFSGSSSSTDGTTYYAYDELGRVISATLPNGQSTTYYYSLNTVTATEPLPLHTRQEAFDAFGNMVSVLEPDASGSLTWQTSYLRSDLGALTEVDQKGGSTDPSQWHSRYFSYDGLGRLSSQTTPEAGQYSYTYDNNGNVLSFTNQNGTANTVNFSYDALNRVLTKQVGGGPNYTYTYDSQDASGDPYGIGRLTGTSDGASVQTRYKHDPAGHVVSEADCRPSDCSFGYQTTAAFDFLGNLRALTSPDGRKIEWVYDTFNRPVEEVNTFWNADEIDVPLMVGGTYYPTGQLQDVIDGSGVELTTSVDPDGNITNLTYNNGAPLISRNYTWSPNARNLTGITDTASGRTQAFSYDQLDRLISATDTGSTGSGTTAGLPSVPSSSMSYSYDPWGNLQQSGTYSFAQPYDLGNHVSGSGYGYDAAGNQTSDGLGNTYAYRADGHQTSSNGTTYAYDALDQRVVKNGSSTTENFYFGGNLIATRDASSGAWTDVLYGANGVMAEVDGTEYANPTYRIEDQLGTLTQTTDVNGNVIGGATVLPFGQLLSNTTSDSLLFTEDQSDQENATASTPFRQYSPAQGRWLSPDPYSGSYDLTNPQSLNRYVYAQNTPLTATDPTGLDAFTCLDVGGYSSCEPVGGSGGDGGAGYPDNGDGSEYTLLGGSTTVTLLPYGGTTDPGFAARQSYQYSGPGVTSANDSAKDSSALSKTNQLLQCASKTANQFSIAGVLGLTGEGGGMGSTIGTAFLGNTFSGIVDAGTHIYNNATAGGNGNEVMGDLILGGGRQGLPGGGPFSKGVAGIVTEAGVNAITRSAPVLSIAGPAAEIGAEGMAGPVGWAKLGLDAAVFLGSALSCASQ